MNSIISAIQDLALFAPWFRGDTWRAWFSFLTGLFGLSMNDQENQIFCKYTGRSTVPKTPAHEAWVVVGRRGGKSLVAALVATFMACFKDYASYLGPGEVATVMVIAADRKQARVVMRYIVGFIEAIPMLASMLKSKTREQLELSNRVVIEVHTCNFRAVRGYTIAVAICDEVAFWRSDESANPDTEVIAALRPALSTIPSSLLLCISSPYARRGALWDAYQKHYGKDNDPVLVWQANTKSMNPSIDPQIIDQAYEEDESAAAAEYGAEFRRDVEAFVSRESVEACTVPGRIELPFVPHISYVAFTDPSGGTSDSMTLAIAHREDDRAILDVIRERKPPFSPEGVTREFADLMKSYRIHEVTGDRYGGEWPREQFRKQGIEYRPSERSKSEIYLELLPALNSGRTELLSNARLIAQLCGLERRTARGGRESIDHPPNGHDDLANASAGAITKALGQGTYIFPELREVTHNLDNHFPALDGLTWKEFHLTPTLKKIASLNHSATGTAFLIVAVNAANDCFVLEEYCERYRQISQNALYIRDVMTQYSYQDCAFFIQGAEQTLNRPELYSILDAYRREGIRAALAYRTSVGVGFDLIKEYLRYDPDHLNPFTQKKGSPRIFISRSRCPNLWREMAEIQYQNEDGRAKYIGLYVCIDNLRCILMSRPKPPAPRQEKPKLLGIDAFAARVHERWAGNWGKKRNPGLTWF